MALKRRRSENFSVDDKELLIERIILQKEIIENKKTDVLSVKAKNQAWKLITNEYNARTNPRSTAALKTCWENLKRKYRRMNALKTGNGQQIDPLLSKIRNALSFSLEELQNPYDSDVLYDERSDDIPLDEMYEENTSVDSEDLQEDTFGETTESQWCSSPLKKSMCNILNDGEQRTAVYKSSSTTLPHVHTLASRGTTSEPDVHVLKDSASIQFTVSKKENSPSPSTNMSKSSVKWPSHSRSQQGKNYSNALAESKLELARLAKEHAIAEEKRKVELHELQLQEAKLKVEILKLELKRKKAE